MNKNFEFALRDRFESAWNRYDEDKFMRQDSGCYVYAIVNEEWRDFRAGAIHALALINDYTGQ